MSNPLAFLELYCPAHFGNTYESCLDNEMAALLGEAKGWGFTRYSDWFDTIDLADIYARKHNLFNLPEAMWARKLANYQIAARLGLELGLCVTPNHVFADQVTPANAAVKGDLVFGQLVCPNKPGVLDLILGNYANLFNDFKSRGLRLKSVCGAPYDYGGCNCEKCRPWIVSFGKLMRAIVDLARKSFGEVEANLIGWWWTEEEHKLFAQWADAEAPGYFGFMAYHLPYGVREYVPRAVPKGCAEGAFVHIGYGERTNRDSYAHVGGVAAPQRLEATCRHLIRRGARGLIAYSEGAFDEINKAILAGICSGQYSSAHDVMVDYAHRHLGTDPEGWARWLTMMGEPYEADALKARELFDELACGALPGWRFDQLEDRMIMCEAHAQVMSRTTWDAQRVEAAQLYWDTKEHLFRKVYHFGLLRHILRYPAYAPAWDAEYRKVLNAATAPATPAREDA